MIVARIYLVVSGLILIGLGGLILLAPVTFYSSYDLTLDGQATLLNELRSHGLFLAVVGAFVAYGGLRHQQSQPALVVASMGYLSYGLARLLGIALDGWPHSGLVLAAVLETLIGLTGLGLLIFTRRATA